MNTPRVNLNSQKFKRATAALWYYNQDFSSEISEFVSDPLYTDPFRFKFVISQKVIDGYNSMITDLCPTHVFEPQRSIDKKLDEDISDIKNINSL